MTADKTANQSLTQALAAWTRWLSASGESSFVRPDPAAWLGHADVAEASAPVPESRPERAPEPKAKHPTPTVSQPIVQATDLAALRAEVAAFEGCPLKRTATTTVFADGNPAARVMLIGEAPGADEDRRGLPFVGAAGQLLDKMMATIGLSRTAEAPEAAFYITNTVFWRPPGNREPTPAELQACLPFVHRHIALVQPHLIITLGNVPLRALIDPAKGITRARGTWATLDVEGHTIPALPMFHPAYLLRQPAHKAFAWADLLAVQAKLREPRHAD
jgi:DNA polymerase